MKQLPDASDPGRTKFPLANTPKEVGSRFWGAISGSDAFQASNDASLFSSSLPVLPLEKLNLTGTENGFPTLGVSPSLDKFHQDMVGNNPLEDIETHTPHGLLPDDENELLAGIMDDFDLNGLPTSLEDLEDGDLFGSSGGMELESGLQDSLSMGLSKLSLSDAFLANGIPQYGLPNGVGAIAGEHPYGEHPSRTLFVRNINSNVEDSELRALFEQYGDIRTLYTACKHRGFVMISYYDIRAARTAMRALQNKPLRRRKLDIHFSIPKDNPSEKDINQGTLVVFNLDPSVSNEDLRQIFGAYGEVKEIRETPHKRHHKFIEYYDVRAADAALKSLNRSDIAGKRIKLEPSRPGGARRNLMLQLNQEVEQDESRGFRHQVDSPIASSPPGNWLQFHSPVEHSLMHTISNSPGFRGMSPASGNHISGLTSIMNSQSSNFKIAPIGKDQGRGSLVEHAFTNSNSIHEAPNQQAHSLPSFGQSSSNGSGVETLSGPQFLWGSPNRYSQPSNSSGWPTSSMDHSFASSGKSIGIPFSGRQGSLLNSSQLHNHHIGSAPSGIPLQRHFGFFPNSPDNNSFMNSVAFGGTSVGHNEGSFMMNMPARGSMNSGISIPRNVSENGSSNMRMMSSPSLSPVLLGNGPYSGLVPPGMEAVTERVRSRRIENNGNQADNKLLFQLDLEKIRIGADTRTTLMIKNIPNKYTSKMLLAAIDENHRGTFDFLYLPIDFKNKCNVGYAFINMLSPSLIIPFYETFNGKKWEKFNSEKVASLAYARIQGKTALVTHFQNSSLMNEDKRCRPILFHPEGLDGGDQDQMNPSLNIVRQPNGTSSANPLYISESDYAGEMPEAS